jgi:hypothetical protein
MAASNTIILIKTIFLYCFPLITIVGIFGNAFAFFIFSQKSFQNTVFSIYFRFLIICDSISLLLPINRFLELNFNIFMSKISNEFCKFRYYFAYAITPISGWISAAISLDRLISIKMPSKFLFRKKTWFQVLVCLIIFCFDFAYYLQNLIVYSLNKNEEFNNMTNQTITGYSCESNGVSLDWLDLFQSDITPFTLMIIFTSLTLHSIFQSRKRLGSNFSNDSSKQKDVKFAITSIAINAIFLLFNSPYCLFNVISDYIQFNDISEHHMILAFCYLFFYSNFGSVFYVNIYFNVLFKKEFFKLFSKFSRS